MRTREEILKAGQDGKGGFVRHDRQFHLILEVLTDIRDVLVDASNSAAIAGLDEKHRLLEIGIEEGRKDEREGRDSSLFPKAVEYVKTNMEQGEIISSRDLLLLDGKRISYGKASSLIDQLQDAGVISAEERGKPRRVL